MYRAPNLHAFLKRFGTDASVGFWDDLRMRLIKDSELGVNGVSPFWVPEFDEHHGIFYLLQHTFVDPAAGYLAVRQKMKVD